MENQIFIYILFILFLILVQPLCAQTESDRNFSFQNEPLLEVLKEIEDKTDFYLLYREPQLSGIHVSFSAEPDSLIQKLRDILLDYQIDLTVYPERKQILLHELKENTRKNRVNVSINGYVVDAKTGERLPYATVSWTENDDTEGTVSNEAGLFSLKKRTHQPSLKLTFSYLGYESKELILNVEERRSWNGLAIRLTPKTFTTGEVIVTGVNYYVQSDTIFSNLTRVGTFSPLGEDNRVRTLQTLPAVQIATAVNEGLHVRGSSVNGFRVLLDGISIYNSSHLFGLLDSFNPDVLQNSGFFYDVSPVQFESPTGGTLNLTTRTGSLQSHRGNLGLSNTSIRGTLEGPVIRGRSSFLISGRHSYLNQLDWFGNRDLIKYGLDIDRPSSGFSSEQQTLDEVLIRTGKLDASYYDLHAKFYIEGQNGNRFQLSGYTGQDKTSQKFERCFVRSRNNLCPIELSEQFPNVFQLREMAAINEWGNNSLSARYQFEIGESGYGQTLAALSDYQMYFLKDDFTYQRNSTRGRETVIRPFGIENRLTEFKFKQQADFSFSGITLTTGFSLYQYESEYEEDSFRRVDFSDRSTVSQFDLFGQAELSENKNIHLFTGGRLHYYSEGAFLRVSPRIKMRLFPDALISFGAGYSRSHEFLNQIEISNVQTADIWILANGEQPPTRSDHFSSGLYFHISPSMQFQVEGYLKQIENMRLHESVTQFIPSTIESEVPWYTQNRLDAIGLELLFIKDLGPVQLSQAYTWSETEVENPRINQGEPFYADWDRRHQFYTLAGFQLGRNFELSVAWTYATGAPNRLFEILEATQNPSIVGEVSRLDDLSRIDLSLTYSSTKIEAKLFFYNLTDRKNVWYREFDILVEEIPQAPIRERYSTLGLPVNYYDLGFQPSFNLSVRF